MDIIDFRKVQIYSLKRGQLVEGDLAGALQVTYAYASTSSTTLELFVTRRMHGGQETPPPATYANVPLDSFTRSIASARPMRSAQEDHRTDAAAMLGRSRQAHTERASHPRRGRSGAARLPNKNARRHVDNVGYAQVENVRRIHRSVHVSNARALAYAPVDSVRHIHVRRSATHIYACPSPPARRDTYAERVHASARYTAQGIHIHACAYVEPAATPDEDPQKTRVVQRATQSPHELVSSTTRRAAYGTERHVGTTRAERKEGFGIRSHARVARNDGAVTQTSTRGGAEHSRRGAHRTRARANANTDSVRARSTARSARSPPLVLRVVLRAKLFCEVSAWAALKQDGVEKRGGAKREIEKVSLWKVARSSSFRERRIVLHTGGPLHRDVRQGGRQ
ncbi:hypothetical protein C8J57DRAFT_1231005 [Mycena rebaudengoi]|nr:hypothetical protein C8J57DRAFT_1231005 [Mycena rebaudengoi]